MHPSASLTSTSPDHEEACSQRRELQRLESNPGQVAFPTAVSKDSRQVQQCSYTIVEFLDTSKERGSTAMFAVVVLAGCPASSSFKRSFFFNSELSTRLCPSRAAMWHLPGHSCSSLLLPLSGDVAFAGTVFWLISAYALANSAHAFSPCDRFPLQPPPPWPS